MDEEMPIDPMQQQPMDEGVMAMPEPPLPKCLQKLDKLLSSQNLAEDMDETELGDISGKAILEYQIDDKSRDAWLERNKAGMDLAMLVAEKKDSPFEGAANVKYPLVTTAALQFNARAYPAIVQGNRVAKCATWGFDPDGMKAARGDRVSEHLSYQLLAELPEWESDTDTLLTILSIVGCAFRKVYYDPSLRRNTTRLVTADRLVVNYFARSLEDAPRVTEEMKLYAYEIEERIRSGRFIKFDYTTASPDDGTIKEGRIAEEAGDPQDSTAPHLFLEQHRLLDLDKDGYPEPYIVTVHFASGKVCRIVANFSTDTVRLSEDETKIVAIRKKQYYVKYLFMPSFDGGFYGTGFGALLKDIGEAINTSINQQLDASTLANMQGGLVSSQLGIKERTIKLGLGQWKVINTSGNIKDGILPITYPGPNQAMFNLLGMLIEAGKEVAAIKDVLTGEGMGKNASPTTTMALIEQGLQVFTAIYKRIHRALKAELGLHAALNREHLVAAKYNEFFDGKEQFDPKADYNEQDCDILPVSDPATVSKMQKIAKAEFIAQVSAGNPLINPEAVLRRLLEAADVEDIDELIMPPPQPNPEEEQLKRELSELALESQEADIAKTEAETLKMIADAEAAETGQQMQIYMAILDHLRGKIDQAIGAQQDGQGGIPPVEGQPDDPMGLEAAGPEGIADGGALGGAPMPIDGGDPTGMGQPASAGGL